MNRSRSVSRRRFLASAAMATTGVWLMPRRLWADTESPVITIRNAAATAKINVTKLRSNVGLLEGSGGNIAVLTGRDGKLLVDGLRPHDRESVKR
jgi:hypothetical protein